jgi:hypothetical protein
MLRINSRKTLSGLLLCLSFGTMSSFAAPQAGTNGNSSALNTSSSGGSSTNVKWDRIVGLVTAQGLSNPVAGIASGTTPWTTSTGAVAVDLTNGEAVFFVQGLVLVGGNASGTPGPVTSVKAALVCNAGTDDQAISESATVPLDGQGNAQFRGALQPVPPSACSNPLFLVLNAAKNVWIGTAAVRTIETAP